MARAVRGEKKALTYFNTKTRVRYYGMKQRCENQNDKDYKYYGGRGIKVKISSKEFREFCKGEIERLGYRISSHADLVTFFSNYHVDRIDGNGNYERGNITFEEAMSNVYASGKNHHVLLKKDEYGELWCPCSLFDYVLGRRNKLTKTALISGYRRGITTSKKYYLDFLYINPNEPPVPIDRDFCIECPICRERVKLCSRWSRYLYKCKRCGAVKNRMNTPYKSKFDYISKEDFDICLEYLYQHLRSYDGKTKAPKDG